MTNATDDAGGSGALIADIAALARQLAEMEPFQSASGPDALRALAARLDAMVAPSRSGQPAIVQVAVRRKRKKPAG